jgi:hypothetical protein
VAARLVLIWDLCYLPDQLEQAVTCKCTCNKTAEEQAHKSAADTWLHISAMMWLE